MVDAENALKVAQMSVQEREQEVEELKQRFGADLLELIRRRKERKAKGLETAPKGEAGPSVVAKPSASDFGIGEKVSKENENAGQSTTSRSGKGTGKLSLC